jgi:hypothetical protein
LSWSSISSRCARASEPGCARDGLAGEIVECRREPLGDPAAVDEDDRGAMRAHVLEQPWMDRGPD